MNYTNKVIMITGASSGIGEALTEKIARDDCRIAVLARSIDKLNELADKLNKNKKKVFAYKCDVSNRDEVQSAYKNIKDELGVPDISILNSGVGSKVDIHKYSSQDAKMIMDVNVMGMIYFVEALLPDLLERKDGVIAGVSSLADSRGFPGSGFYCASKAAATIYLESLREELLHHNIRVLTVKPGFVKTPMTDKNEFKMPFLMPVDKAAEIMYKKIKKEKRMIRFPLPTALGSRLLGVLPHFIFHMIAKDQIRD